MNATRRLALAGDRGSIWSDHIARGHDIVRGLRGTDLHQRLVAIGQWEDWVATHPGPFTWRRDDTIVAACKRIEQVNFEARDVTSPMYRGTPDQPVQLRVSGPVDLQVEVRPLHELASHEPLNDWLVIRGSGREQVWPITGNRPTDSLQLATDAKHLAGRKVQTQVHLGPGLHELSVAAEANDILVRVATRQPLCALAMLPPVTPATVAAVVSGKWGVQTLADVSDCSNDPCPLYARVIHNTSQTPWLATAPLWRQLPARDARPLPLASGVTAYQRAVLGLRDGTLTALEACRAVESQAGDPAMLRGDEMYELAARAGSAPTEYPWLSDPQRVVDWQWMLVYRGQLRQALRVDPGSDEVRLRAQVALLVRLAEQQPSMRAECAVRLAELAQRRPTDGFAAAQLDRIKEPGEWAIFREVDASAGLFALPESGPQPVFQAQQVRYALARPVASQAAPVDYLLSGFRRLSLDIVESRPIVIELVWRQPRIGFLPAPQLHVEIQVDELAPRVVAMPPLDETQRIELPLAAGQHHLRVRIQNPYAGHYVALNVNEINSVGERIRWQQQGGTASADRLYHVATPATPVQLRLQGPAWVRIERMLEGRRETREMTIAPDDREITLTAPAGADNALYRIWEYRFGARRTRAPAVHGVGQSPADYGQMAGAGFFGYDVS